MNRLVTTRALTLAAALVLGACQSTGGGRDSHYWTLPEGSALELTRELQVTSGWARVTLQHGQVVHPNAIDRGEPSCELRVGQAATREAPITVAADRFALGPVNRRYASASARAALASLIFIEDERDDRRTFQTNLPLSSPRQPLVRYMTCEITGDPRWLRHLSLEQIRETLGEVFALRLPDA